MELKHSFTVPVDRATAWAAFQDIESVAECFPGATVTSVEDDTFQGTCKVKLGPIAMQYSGSGTWLERDPEGFRMRLEAKGRDKRGNGTAGAVVDTVFLEEGPTSTRVEVATDLNITGKPAQFGRGVMQDVSDKLLGQFVDCLESRIGPQPETAVEAGGGPATVDVQPPTQPTQPPEPTQPAGPGAAELDLGSTVLPVLARTYAKPAAAVLLALLVLRWWWRRR